MGTPRIGGKNQEWSEEHLEYIRQNYGKLSVEEIKTHLGRSRNSVTAKARRLGIQRAMPLPVAKEPKTRLSGFNTLPPLPSLK